jgi:hypothetical protein
MSEPITEPTPDPEPAPEPEPEPENPDAEPDEDDDEDEDEAEPAGPPPPPSSVTVLEKRDKLMNSAAKSHETRLHNILGDDFDAYMPCPLCLADAFLLPKPAGAMPPEQWEAVQAAAGQLQVRQLKRADYTETCDTCDGEGKLDSGSHDPTFMEIPCRACEGKGWKMKLAEVPAVPAFTFPAAPAAPAPLNLDFTGPKDNWGRPAGHPHFGIEPALVA